MRKFILMLFCILFLQAQAQIRITDQTDSQPVAFAHLLTDDGKLAATSDMNGVVDTTMLGKTLLTGNNHISIQQIAYETLIVSSAELRNAHILGMKRRIISLPEVIIDRKSKEVQYIVLKGFFRSYHLENGTPKFYSDGIGEYYISTDGKDIKFKMREFRTFRNDSQIVKVKKRTFVVVIGMICIPQLNKGKNLSDQLGKNYSFIPTPSGADIIRDKVKAGFVRITPSTGSIQTNIDLLSPKKEKVFSLLNYIVRTVSNNHSEVFRTTDLNQLTYDNLESITNTADVYFKHKKDPVDVENTGLSEFYIYETTIIPKSSLKGIKFNGLGLRHTHSYTHEYWKELPMHHIPPLSKNIEEALGKILIMY